MPLHRNQAEKERKEKIWKEVWKEERKKERKKTGYERERNTDSYHCFISSQPCPSSQGNAGWECSLVGRALDRYNAYAGSIPRCGKGYFSKSQLSVHSLTVSIHPRMQLHT